MPAYVAHVTVRLERDFAVGDSETLEINFRDVVHGQTIADAVILASRKTPERVGEQLASNAGARY